VTVGGFPTRGTDWTTLSAELEALKAGDADWRRGQLASYTYFFRESVLDVQKAAYTAYIAENGLASPKVLQSVPQMLADIGSMTRDLFGAPDDAGFSFTSGGTESIFCAVKAARDRARAERGERFGHYNVVAPLSAHPALDKAGHYLDVEVRRTPLDPALRSDVPAMEAACDEDTIMLYASAPSYVYGVFDRVAEISELALRSQLWLHVDGCWGGFISPFARTLGYAVPDWDLSLPGVTTLSADIHKFGYAAKGAGVLLFRDPALQEFERFEFSGWPHGTYATATFTGSKPAGPVAAAWAVLRHLGEEGYLVSTREAMDATVGIRAGIEASASLAVLSPVVESNIVVFVSTDPEVDVMAVADRLEELGWFRGKVREPRAVHQGVNPAHLGDVDAYVTDLHRAVADVRSARAGAYDERTY
jgi:sphinganine-1-phosphate aldolase